MCDPVAHPYLQERAYDYSSSIHHGVVWFICQRNQRMLLLQCTPDTAINQDTAPKKQLNEYSEHLHVYKDIFSIISLEHSREEYVNLSSIV